MTAEELKALFNDFDEKLQELKIIKRHVAELGELICSNTSVGRYQIGDKVFVVKGPRGQQRGVVEVEEVTRL